MNSSNTGPFIISGIFKRILCNALTGFLCNELNALYNSINNLKINKYKEDYIQDVVCLMFWSKENLLGHHDASVNKKNQNNKMQQLDK